MPIIRTVVQAVFFLNCLALIGLILLQMSEHASMGGAFGSGMSGTVFGRDVTKDPKKIATGILGGLFLGLGLLLTILP
ncbi:TPA: preprotein translocase subunit SecG [Candidatus Acetothermia bacterium]|nr:preprotein translocase subunit SecG [Candidatus Acetothermia bacterium]